MDDTMKYTLLYAGTRAKIVRQLLEQKNQEDFLALFIFLDSRTIDSHFLYASDFAALCKYNAPNVEATTIAK